MTSLLIFTALICLGYRDIFALYLYHYWTDRYLYGLYTLGPYILLTSGLLSLLRSRKPIPNCGEFINHKAASLLFITGLLLKGYGEIQGFSVLRGISLIPILLGFLALFYRRDIFRAYRFPILFLLLAIPMPTFLIDVVTRPLLDINAVLAYRLLLFSGIDVLQEGARLITSDPTGAFRYEIILVGGCSGLRSLMTFLAIGTLYFHWRSTALCTAILLMLAACPVALVLNLFRICITVVMMRWMGPGPAERFFHYNSGILMFALIMGALFVMENGLDKLRDRRKRFDPN